MQYQKKKISCLKNIANSKKNHIVSIIILSCLAAYFY